MPAAWIEVLRRRPFAWAAAAATAFVLLVAVVHTASFQGFVHPQRVDYRTSPDGMDGHAHHRASFAPYGETYAP